MSEIPSAECTRSRHGSKPRSGPLASRDELDRGSPVVLLATDGPSTRIVYHALRAEFGDVVAILEHPVSRFRLLRRRVNRLGLITVVGQVLFILFVVPVLRVGGRQRIREIVRDFDLAVGPIPEPVIRVSSANSAEARAALRELRPSVVVVNGTRIIGSETLACVGAPFVNTHTGITPMYRGVHGGYWALFDGRGDLIGTTVHLVDDGIDTGTALAQVGFEVTERDSFATYPYLHYATILPHLLAQVKRVRDRTGPLNPGRAAGEFSSVRSHPTLWGYIWKRAVRGVK